MKIKSKQGIIFPLIFLLFHSGNAQEIDIDKEGKEDLSLRVDEILVPSGTLRLFTALTYIARAKNTGIAGYETVDIPGLGMTTLPTSFSELYLRDDSILFSGGLRYGITPKLELATAATWDWTRAQTSSPGFGGVSETRSDFSSMALGATYRIREDDGVFPAVLLGINSSAIENEDPVENEYSYFGSGRIFVSGYMVMDPVILTGSIGYQHRRGRTVSESNVGASDSFSLSPGFSIALNDRITTSVGINIQWLPAVTVDGVESVSSRTNGQLTLGLGYVFDGGNTIQFSSGIEVLGENSVSAGLSMSF